MLFWYKNGLKGEVFHSFANSKGKMVITRLKKYDQILYQKIALRVWVPTQQTERDFEFSSPSYACFTKMCLAGKGALDMSKCLRVKSKILIFGQRGVEHVDWGSWTCQKGLGLTPFILFSHINNL